MSATCSVCGGNHLLELHMIDGNINNISDDNTQVLCHECHNNAHMR